MHLEEEATVWPTNVLMIVTVTYLQVIHLDPLEDPPQPAVTGQEPPAEAEAPQGLVQVREGLLGQGCHGVAVQGKEGQAWQPLERVEGQRAEKVEAEIENL